MWKALLFNRANLVFALVMLAVLLLPSQAKLKPVYPLITVLFAGELLFLWQYGRTGRKSAVDIAFIGFLVMGFWEVATKLGVTHGVLVPPPENVFYVFVSQRALILQGLISSLTLLFWGFAISLTAGISLGLIVGWVPRLRQAFFPIAKVLAPIPPLVYTPYVVALMPTFRLASIVVIFAGIFWPTFMNMVNRVGGMDKKMIDSAGVLGVSTPTMLFKVILPYSLPGIVSGLSLSISVAFMCLTGAELLGASAGLGYFVKKFSDYADYTKVVAGIIFIGFVVTMLNLLVKTIEKHAIKWKY